MVAMPQPSWTVADYRAFERISDILLNLTLILK